MPIPRPTIRQIRKGDLIHVARPDGSGDVTEAMQAYGKKVAAKLQSGFENCRPAEHVAGNKSRRNDPMQMNDLDLVPDER